MSEQVRFETPEDVALAFELAGPASRLAAAFLDYLLITVLLVALVVALASGGMIALRVRDVIDPSTWSQLSGVTVAVLVAAAFGLNTLYFVLLEWLYAGQTPGKRLLGLRVVRDGGYALSFMPAFLRNVMRPVDMVPIFYLVGLVALLISRERKRLGDQVAGTLVVRHDRAPRPTVRFPGESYTSLGQHAFAFERGPLLALAPDTLSLLDGYFERQAAVQEDHRSALTRSIAQPLAKKLGVELRGQEELFLKELYLALRSLSGP